MPETVTLRGGRLGLAVRNLLFAAAVPGLGGVLGPWLVLGREVRSPLPAAWPAVVMIAAGCALYVWCQTMFAVRGGGTPGLWDPPRRLVEGGPFRWLRNPIYVAALLVVLGQAWLFSSVDLLLYAAALAAGFHLLVVAVEEPLLQARFGEPYRDYRRRVRRWIPRWPAA